MRKVLITRYGACGDHLHATHLPRALKEIGFDHVAIEYNVKGKNVWANNPFVDEHLHFEPSHYPQSHWPISVLEKRWKAILEEGEFEKHINLQNSLEYGYIAMENQSEYYLSSEERRMMYGGRNYYDQTSLWAGYPEFTGRKGELYFTEEEEAQVKAMYEARYKENFVIVLNLSGTSKHKLFYNAKEVIEKFHVKHPDSFCLTMGDDITKTFQFEGDRIRNLAGVCPIRQSMLITKYANLVIGCESGLMVAANLLGAPTIQLMTAASIKNHGGDMKNDYSLQSPCKCSPCHKGPYQYIGCPKFEDKGEKYPECIKFDVDTILNKMEKIYDAFRASKDQNANLSAV